MDEKRQFLSLHAFYLPIQVLKTSLVEKLFYSFLLHLNVGYDTVFTGNEPKDTPVKIKYKVYFNVLGISPIFFTINMYTQSLAQLLSLL